MKSTFSTVIFDRRYAIRIDQPSWRLRKQQPKYVSRKAIFHFSYIYIFFFNLVLDISRVCSIFCLSSTCRLVYASGPNRARAHLQRTSAHPSRQRPMRLSSSRFFRPEKIRASALKSNIYSHNISILLLKGFSFIHCYITNDVCCANTSS